MSYMDRYRVDCDDCGAKFMEWEGGKLRVIPASGEEIHALLCELCIARIIEELEHPARKIKRRRR